MQLNLIFNHVLQPTYLKQINFASARECMSRPPLRPPHFWIRCSYNSNKISKEITNFLICSSFYSLFVLLLYSTEYFKWFLCLLMLYEQKFRATHKIDFVCTSSSAKIHQSVNQSMQGSSRAAEEEDLWLLYHLCKPASNALHKLVFNFFFFAFYL